MFVRNHLSVFAYAKGHTLWHYYTTDTLAEVATLGYFDPCLDMMNRGDIIQISAWDGGAQAFVAATRPKLAVHMMCSTPTAAPTATPEVPYRAVASDLLAVIEDILSYTGGADHATEDPYLMERAKAAVDAAKAAGITS